MWGERRRVDERRWRIGRQRGDEGKRKRKTVNEVKTGERRLRTEETEVATERRGRDKRDVVGEE